MRSSPAASPSTAAPFVSVVIPTCNRRAVVQRCIEALARQTYAAFEVIVVDDGSADDTPVYLEEVPRRHPSLSFRWFRNEPQQGANAARNRGVRESRGAIVALLDDDCVPEPTWVEGIVEAFAHDRVGAVTGTVLDPPPVDAVSLFFKGSHHVYSPDGVRATRLVGCNMAVRRELLLRYAFDEDRADADPDVSVSGRGDECSLFPLLRAAGWEQRIAPRAVVLHDHPHSGRSFFRQAYRSGAAHARLGYKYRLRPPLELVCLLAVYLTLPLTAWGRWGWVAPTACAIVFLVGIFHSERSRKNKTVGEAIRVYPLVLVYYHIRLAGYLVQWLRLLLGVDRIRRVSIPGREA